MVDSLFTSFQAQISMGKPIIRTKNFVIQLLNFPSPENGQLMLYPVPVVTQQNPSLFTILISHINEPDKILWQGLV